MNTEVVIGIDIGGTNTEFGIVDKEGNILSQDSVFTNHSETIDEFLKHITDKINNSLHHHISTSSHHHIVLKAIGIGAPNANYYHGTIENAVNLKWKGILPITNLVKSYFNVPVFVTNDANAAAIGEMLYGGAKGMKDFIVITLGTGLGSGFVVNGKLMYGSTGFAGELGHVIVEPDGRLCGCGRKGCLETYVSAPGITKTVIEILSASKERSTLRNYELRTLNSKLIYEAALKKDPVALRAFDFTSRLLGISLANTVAITSPEAIFLFGGLAQAGDMLLKPAQKYMELNMLHNFSNTVKLLPSSLEQNNAAILGTAALAWHELHTFN